MGDVRVERHDNMPGCSRCGEDVALHVRLPAGDGVDLELCLACDAGRGAAGRLVEHFPLPADQKVPALWAALVEEWIREEMGARGWRHSMDPEPPREGLLADDRSAAVMAAARIGAQRNRRASLN